MIRHEVFWPPFVLILSALLVSLFFPQKFHEVITEANQWVLKWFGWLFSYTALALFLICCLLLFSPVSKIKLGGANAEPFFNRWKWFAIILCTTIATGILFWSTSEPLYHFTSPPVSKAIEAGSREAAVFALSTLFLHWSFTPYAIYAVPAVIFALAYYNSGSSFSLTGMLRPLMNKPLKAGSILDIISLYALVLGMSASLGAGIMMVSGGIDRYLMVDNKNLLLLLVTLLIVLTFVISAATGLFRGIKYLSLINMVIFIILIVYVGINSQWSYLTDIVPSAFKDYILNFFEKSLFTGNAVNDPWPKEWSVFYWANWMAWAPITALFLGRIAKGRTVREFLIFNWILPSLFALVWMSVFGGNILAYENMDGGISEVLHSNGPDSVIYALFEKLPLHQLIIPFFIFLIYISYVTAADSNTEAIGGLCTKDFLADMLRPLLGAKIIWGIIIGGVSFIMISSSGIDGIRMLSNLGGLPALFLLVVIAINAILIVVRSYRKFSE